MKTLTKLLTASALAFGTFAIPAQAQSIQGLGVLALDPVEDGNTVLTIAGNGTVTTAPDIALFTAGVVSVAETAEEALRQNAAQTQAVMNALRRNGVAERDIQTGSLAIVPVMSGNYDPYLSGGFYGYDFASMMMEAEIVAGAAMAAAEATAADAMDDATGDAMADAAVPENAVPRILGYRVANSLNIRQRDLSEYGPMIDALVAAGVNRVNGPVFQLEDDSALLDEARSKAIADARRRAQLYATAADMRITRIIMIEESAAVGLSSQSGNAFGYAEAVFTTDAYYPTQVSSGELSVSATVGIMFELTPN